MAGETKTYRGTADDFMQISQLFARYNQAVDNGDGDGWASTFTEDGVFHDETRCVQGRSALAELVGRNPRLGKDRERFHVQSLGPIIYTDRNHASVRSTILVLGVAADGNATSPIITAVASDELKRESGNWYILYRTIDRNTNDSSSVCSKPPIN